MELQSLDTKTPSEEGAFLHLKDPFEGHLLYAGDNADDRGRIIDEEAESEDDRVGVFVRGYESATVQKTLKRVRRQNMKDAQKMTTELMGRELATAMIIDFQNLSFGGAPLTDSREDKIKFLNASDNLVDQVSHFSRATGNFTPNASSD